jgi:hypothetical protein
MARPLHDLTKKDVTWRWTSAEQQAFQSIKDAFIREPILAQWDPERRTRVETDASGYTTGGVISQLGDDGFWHPIAFRSESMTETERNYEVYDRELLAIIRALEDWRHFLEELPEQFEVWTNHKNLDYWRTARDLTRRQARWSLYLSRFNLKIVPKPGKSNILADALSRLPGSYVPDSKDNRQVVMLTPEHFLSLAAATLRSLDAFKTDLRAGSQRKAEVVDALKKLRRNGPRKLANGGLEWEESNGLVYFQGHLYVPRDAKLCQEAVARCHDAMPAGHPGQNGTLERVQRLYWWPGLERFVRQYVDGCDVCA